ncbi:MAG: hypothetical protein H6924_01805 [Alphaproteobacteria bacterium]|nr:hypothetical protein [Alphaproteobacteria bacterium]
MPPTSRSFGRRAASVTPARFTSAPVTSAPFISASGRDEAPPPQLPGAPIDWSASDPELDAWKQARRGGGMIPWRQMSLMASLCFGIASFVLPDDVNRTVNWLLYGLMAVSFIAGIRKRNKA